MLLESFWLAPPNQNMELKGLFCTIKTPLNMTLFHFSLQLFLRLASFKEQNEEKNIHELDSGPTRLSCAKPRWRALGLANMQSAIWRFYLVLRIPFACGKNGSEENSVVQMRGRRKWSAHKRGAGSWMPPVPPAGTEAGSMEGARKVILDTNQGPGACHPSPVPGHARCRNGGCGLRTTEHLHQHKESFGRLLRRLQGLEQRRSVSMSTSMSATDSTSWEAQGRREAEALSL